MREAVASLWTRFEKPFFNPFDSFMLVWHKRSNKYTVIINALELEAVVTSLDKLWFITYLEDESKWINTKARYFWIDSPLTPVIQYPFLPPSGWSSRSSPAVGTWPATRSASPPSQARSFQPRTRPLLMVALNLAQILSLDCRCLISHCKPCLYDTSTHWILWCQNRGWFMNRSRLGAWDNLVHVCAVL